MTTRKQRAHRLWLRLIAWLFPERCIFCGKAIPSLTLCCDACRRKVEIIRPPLCPFCGAAKADCDCHRRRHRYDRVVAPFYSDGPIYEGLIRLKRTDDPQAIGYFADQMAAVVRREFAEESIKAVVAVPMMADAEYDRGYNQSVLLAQALAQRLVVPYRPILAKRYATKEQKRLSAWQRTGNVLGAFDVTDATSLAGSTILLVDDMLTTGATTDECAKMLKLYGAARVLCVTAAIRRHKKSATDK